MGFTRYSSVRLPASPEGRRAPSQSGRLRTLALALSLATACPFAVQAQFTPEVIADVEINGQSDSQTDPLQAAVEMIRTLPVTGGFATGRAFADSRQGRLLSRAEAEVVGSQTASMDSRAFQAFHDELLIDAPGLTGQPGTFTASVRITGRLTTGASNIEFPHIEWATASAQGRFLLSSATGGFVFEEFALESSSLSPPLGPIVVPVPLTLAFVFGQPIEVQLDISLEAFCRSGNPESYGCIAIAEFSNSAYWTGIDMIVDGEGTEVTEYTVTSASGTDWTQSFENLLVFANGFEAGH